MKRLFSAAIAAVLTLTCAAAAAGPRVEVADKERALFTSEETLLVNDRTLVPAEPFCEILGLWFTQENGKAVVADGEHSLGLSLDSNVLTADGVEQGEIDVSAKIVNGTVYLPLRLVAEAFGSTIVYYPATEAIPGMQEGSEAFVVISTPQAQRITVCLPQDAPEDTATLFDIAETITNTLNCDVIQIPAENAAEKVKLMVAAGEPAVFMEPNADESVSEALQTLCSSGAFAPLGELIETYAPNVFAMLQADEELLSGCTGGDGEIYAFPVQTGEGSQKFYVSATIDEPEKAVSLLHGYQELLRALSEADETPAPEAEASSDPGTAASAEPEIKASPAPSAEE